MTLDVHAGPFDDDLEALTDRIDCAADAAADLCGLEAVCTPFTPKVETVEALSDLLFRLVGRVGSEPTTDGL